MNKYPIHKTNNLPISNERYRCLLCKGEEIKPLYEKNNCQVVKCKRCNFIWVPSIPPIIEEDFYEKEYFCSDREEIGYKNYIGDGQVSWKRRKSKDYYWHQQDYVSLVQRFKEKGKLLDIGCASGFFLKKALERGFKTVGVEISKYASNYGRENFGLQIFNGTLKEANFKNEEFDVITMWHVLEHLVDPESYIEEIYRILKKNGFLFIETPNIMGLGGRLKGVNWKSLRLPEHLNHFSPDTLQLFIENKGFKTQEVSTPTDDPQKRGKVEHLAKIAFYFMRILKLGGCIRLVSQKL